jgi:hypothetical protein
MTTSGRLAYVSSPGTIDADFVTEAKRRGRPESRFRFSGPCVEEACPQWTGCGCGVVDMLVAEETPASDEGLPPCGIRRTCRWFFERGASACAVCPAVVADTGGIGTYTSFQ